MEKIKLFEDFILETSSKRLEDINKAISSVLDNNNANTYDIDVMIYLILCANEDYDKIKQISDEHSGWRDSIIKNDSFTFDMDEGISNFESLTKKNKGKMRQLSNDIDVFYSEEYENALNAIKDILQHYKESKNTEHVDFHSFVIYYFKGERLLRRTNKNSNESKAKVIDTILKNGIDIKGIRKDLDSYEEQYRKSDRLIINTRITMHVGDDFEGNDRFNENTTSVIEIDMWKDYQYKESMINISLFVNKTDYIVGLGYVGSKTVCPVIAYRKGSGEPIIAKKNSLRLLKEHLDNGEKNFGKDKFTEYMENIFKILSDNGVDTNFDYGYMKENIEKEIGE